MGALPSHKMEEGSEHPICFASRTLTQTERNYSNLEGKALSIVFGLKKFHQYLYGRPFTLMTDPLDSLFNEKKSIPTMAAARIQRWALTFAAYKDTAVISSPAIEYKPGTEHSNADALSRLPLPIKPHTTPVPSENVWTMELLNATPVAVKEIQNGTRSDIVLANN